MKTSKLKIWFSKNRSALLILLAVFFGLIVGFTLRWFFDVSPLALTYIGLPGYLLIRAFMFLLVPLIVASLSTGIAGTNIDQNKRMVVYSLLMILLFTSMVSIFGVALTVIMKPGVRPLQQFSNNTNSELSSPENTTKKVTAQNEAIYDVNLVPDNIVGAAIITHYTAVVPNNAQNLSEGYKKVLEKQFTPNLLGLVVFSIVLGITILHLDDKVPIIRYILQETNCIVNQVIKGLMIFMPLGMFSWMCVEAIKMKLPDFKFLANLAWFAGTGFIALISIFLILYPAIYFIVLRKNPFKMYSNIFEAMLLAFGSSSSAVTLPVTMKCMEDNYKLALPISHFFLPLGMTMHMPGTATYCPIIAIFVAQMHGIQLDFAMLVTLSLYSVLMSMAFPATPSQGGLMFFITICSLIGIDNPMDILTLIFSVDLLMGRLRTVMNITGDCVIAAILQKICYKEEGELIEIKIGSPRRIETLIL